MISFRCIDLPGFVGRFRVCVSCPRSCLVVGVSSSFSFCLWCGLGRMCWLRVWSPRDDCCRWIPNPLLGLWRVLHLRRRMLLSSLWWCDAGCYLYLQMIELVNCHCLGRLISASSEVKAVFRANGDCWCIRRAID